MLLPGVHLGSIFLWAIVAEDVLKVLAEAFFLLGFIQALQMTRRMDAEPSAGPATCRSS
jgi:hypothetical protein